MNVSRLDGACLDDSADEATENSDPAALEMRLPLVPSACPCP